MKQNKLIRPTETEDAAITSAALADADNLPLTEADLAQFKRGPGDRWGVKKCLPRFALTQMCSPP